MTSLVGETPLVGETNYIHGHEESIQGKPAEPQNSSCSEAYSLHVSHVF